MTNKELLEAILEAVTRVEALLGDDHRETLDCIHATLHPGETDE